MADNVIQKHGGKVGYENFKINKKTVASQDPNAVLSCLVDIKDVLQQILEGQLEADEITQPIIAAIESQTDALTASLQEICDKLDAGITVNAVQSGTWSVTIDGQPIETSLSTDSINELVAAIEAADLNVTIAGQDQTLDVNITNDPLSVTLDFQPLIDELQRQVSVDYERSETRCIFDANGDEVPNTGVFSEAKYDFFGNQVGSVREVYSILVNGEWQPYTLQAGEVVGRCETKEVCTVQKFEEKTLDTSGLVRRNWHDVPSVTSAQVDADIANGDSSTSTQAVIDAFDYSADPASETVETTLAISDDVPGVGTTANLTEITGFIESVGADSYLQYQTGNQAAIAVYLGINCGPETLVASIARGTGGPASGRTPAILVPEGIHSIRVVAYDYDGANGIWAIRSSATPGGFSGGLLPTQLIAGGIETRCFYGRQCQGVDGVVDMATGATITNFVVPCDNTQSAVADVANTHLIEGCILSDSNDPDSERISAYTVIDDNGDALFEPRPLTDLGFVECCPDG
jgi:hypothetical protein